MQIDIMCYESDIYVLKCAMKLNNESIDCGPSNVVVNKTTPFDCNSGLRIICQEMGLKTN